MGSLSDILRQVGQGTVDVPIVVGGVSLGPQTNNWTCGPNSLRYVAAVWGIDADLREIAEASMSRPWRGTSEVGMAAGAASLGFGYGERNSSSSRGAKKVLDDALKRRSAVIACVDKWEHWIAIVGRTRRGYVVLDSARPGPIASLVSWRKLAARLRHREKGKSKFTYSVAVVTRSR